MRRARPSYETWLEVVSTSPLWTITAGALLLIGLHAAVGWVCDRLGVGCVDPGCDRCR